MRWLSALVTALGSSLALAQAPESLQSIADRYLGADTYCETGKWGMRESPTQGYGDTPFARCAHSDGRFKFIEWAGTPHQIVTWTDGAKFYRYMEPIGLYQEYPASQPYLNVPYATRGELYPAFLSRLFPWRTTPSTVAQAAAHLDDFAPSSALSTHRHTVYERRGDEKGSTSERIWVLNEDQSIVRWEGLQGGDIRRFVEITSQHRNRKLAEEDLVHDVSLFARYSLQNNPKVFITGLFVAAALGGALAWAWLFARADSVQAIVRKRRRIWRFFAWTSGAIAAALAGLAVLSLIGGGSGHPPAIVIVMVMAVWCAIVLGLAALFMLASYPVQLLFERREARVSG
jgi:hypothetical protein